MEEDMQNWRPVVTVITSDVIVGLDPAIHHIKNVFNED